LPPDDADFSTRWRLIKTRFAKSLPKRERRSAVRKARGERGIWQRRFWEHLIRDDADYARHVEYCYINPSNMALSAACRIDRTRLFTVTCGAEFFRSIGRARSSRPAISANESKEDLVDQLFNSSEKRLARVLLLLANFGKEGRPEPILAKISQETLAEMIGTTRSRVSHFMNKFRELGLIDYNGHIEVHSSLLNVVLHDQPQIRS
jgi:CRP-like cAMP-binding protein